MTLITVTYADVAHALTEFLQNPLPISLPLHPNRTPGHVEWLASARGRTGLPSGHEHGISPSLRPELWFWPFSEIAMPLPPVVAAALEVSSHRAALGIGIGAQAGRIRFDVAVNRGEDTGTSSLSELRLVGAELSRFKIESLSGEASVRYGQIEQSWKLADSLYSRTIGVTGVEAFARLQCSRIAVIGAGGTGSLLASQLARHMGQDGRLLLIDPDRLSPHNLPAWSAGYTAQECIGQPKVEVLAAALRELPPQIETLVASAHDWSALAALKRYDLFVSAVDNPAARLTAAFLANLYHRPLLDVATGIFLGDGPDEHRQTVEQEVAARQPHSALFYHDLLPTALLRSGQRTMGADIRFVVPGRTDTNGNCLLCIGGVGNPEEVQRLLKQRQHRQSTRPSQNRTFWKSRAGSSLLVNSETTGCAIRLLMAYLDGQIRISQHWQMDTTLATAPNWRLIEHPPRAECPLCANAGLGDDALSTLEHILQ